MRVEIVYESSCPNIGAARAQLLQAFAQAKVSPQWREWEVTDPKAPDYIHGYGSPTILVNGQDVSADMWDKNDLCCRVYAVDSQHQGVPPLQDIVMAISTPKPITRHSRWQLNTVMLPSIGVALLPKLACPACWPAYTGLLSSLGLGFMDYTPYLLPLTVIFLAIALAALAYRASVRRGYRPLILGICAATILLVGKFSFASDLAMYVGLILLIAASLLNSWPRPPQAGTPCPACIDDVVTQQGNA